MLLKQAIQTCVCGQAITFPEGEIRAKCQCGAVWEIDTGGVWFTNSTAPILAKPVVCSVRSRAERYKNYPKSRRKRRN